MKQPSPVEDSSFNPPLSIRSFPRAIIHFDGDAFFASVEQARNHALRGRPVITGSEKHIVSSMSYEAKAKGITRAMTIRQARELCPDVAVIRSDYELYSLYARRMYAIAKRFTPEVEEYSIDECFADITGLRAYYRMPYDQIALRIKETLERELDITFGVGLGPNKTVAKIASKWKKPAGFTVIPAKHLHLYAADIPISKLWGIGYSTAALLRKLGVETVLDFARKPREWLLNHHLPKPYQEIWHELHGEYIKHIHSVSHGDVKSLITSRTFTPPSRDAAFVLSELSRNIEEVCRKARFHGVRAGHISVYLKTQEFNYRSAERSFIVPTCDPVTVLAHARECFTDIFRPGVLYRTTGVTLSQISRVGLSQEPLFTSAKSLDDHETLFSTVDRLNARMGKRAIQLASSMKASAFRIVEAGSFRGQAGKGAKKRARLELPFLGVVKT